jgi:hypothetical protein
MLAACHGGDDRNEAAAASGVAHFANSPETARSMALRDAYVDFSFDYPAGWSVTPQPLDGTAQNYVRVAAPMVDGYEPYAFLVGYASATGNAARDRASLPAATLDLAARFGAGLRDYRIVSSGPGRLAGYDSQGWRFTANGPGAQGEPPVQIYGRGDLILPPGAARGVVLVTLATSRAADVHEAAEVGERGTLRAILDSFRLARTQPAPAAAAPAPAPIAAPTPLEPEPAPKQEALPPPHPRPAPAPQPATPAPPPAAVVRPAPVVPAAPEHPKQEQPAPVPPAGNGQ